MRKRYDDSKPCSWCNTCPSSFCDCGPCKDPDCEICYRAEEQRKPKPLPVVVKKEWTDEDSEGAGGDR